MNYDEEKRWYVSFCGSYCRTCNWYTGKIRQVFSSALGLLEEHGFGKLLENKVNRNELKKGLKMLAGAGICSGCKAEIAENDRCSIRQCCYKKGFYLCRECSQFPCKLLKENPGVIKFHCIENLIEIRDKGIKTWIDRQWAEMR
ncbi:MAG: DUF3795 domain-containing protein [candidate division WOR-3 bacterium]